MVTEGADRGAGAAGATGVPDGGFEHLAELPADEIPRAHVLRFLLAPDKGPGIGEAGDLGFELHFVERVELLDADERDVGDLVFVPEFQEVVIDFAGGKDDALDLLRLVGERAGEDFVETVIGEVLDLRGGGFEAQHALRRHQDERLFESALHLPPQHMEVLRGRGQVADLDVVLGAKLEEALQPRGGVLGALALVAVREQQHEAARALPLRFRRRDELVDDDLRAIGEVAELRLPQAEQVGVIQRVAVVETEHARLAEQRVVDANPRLVVGDVLEQAPAFAGRLVVEIRVALAERPASAILAAEPHRDALHE